MPSFFISKEDILTLLEEDITTLLQHLSRYPRQFGMGVLRLLKYS